MPIDISLFDRSSRSLSDIDGCGGRPAVIAIRAISSQHAGGNATRSDNGDDEEG
ncbi:hypothetical protein ACFQL7_21590 [Halocatena marina]|uniref:Uncharacterized protein n=1 Tax=Halocatena marina TaxID=2934937 RepID=A0ABD5YXD1_9EURY